MTNNPFITTTSGLAPNAGVVGAPGAVTATSSTQQTIALGTLQFQVQPQAAFSPGMLVSAVYAGNLEDYMVGVVASYINTTLTIDVTGINGSGTYSSWLINLTGGVGPEGPAGAAGPTGSTGPSGGPVNGNAHGLKITNNSSTPSTKIDISAGAAVMVDTNGTSIRAKSVAVTVDLTAGTSTSTANGMDGEARGTSAWLYLYLISNGTNTAGLASLTAPGSGLPTLPAGYTNYVYVGAMYVDGSGNLLRTLQNKNHTNYVVTASSNTAAMPAMANGSAGSVSTPTWVGVALAGFVPATANTVYVSANGDVGGTGVAVIVAPNNAYGNAASTNPPPVAVGTGSILNISALPIEGSNIYWASGGTDGYLFCVGWDDYFVAA